MYLILAPHDKVSHSSREFRIAARAILDDSGFSTKKESATDSSAKNLDDSNNSFLSGEFISSEGSNSRRWNTKLKLVGMFTNHPREVRIRNSI